VAAERERHPIKLLNSAILRGGLRCLRIELRATEIDALVRKKYVKTEARNERNAIIKGLYEFLEDKLDDSPWCATAEA
jgi:hypothetical protein